MGKKSALFGSKTVFLGQEVHYYYMLHILMSSICKFAIAHKNDAFVAKIVNMRLTKIFMAIFAPDERLPTSVTLNTSAFVLILNLCPTGFPTFQSSQPCLSVDVILLLLVRSTQLDW